MYIHQFAEQMAKEHGYQPFTAEERQWQDEFSTQLCDVLVGQDYPADEASQLIQDSQWGYALFEELLVRHRVEAQKLAEYGVTKIRRAALAWRSQPYNRDDGFTAPCEMLIVASDPSYVHPLTQSYDMWAAVPDVRQCDIAITDKCTNSFLGDELYQKHGQMSGYWHSCASCMQWLLAMVRVEREPVRCPQDSERKGKHIREVYLAHGNPTRDLTPFMRAQHAPTCAGCRSHCDPKP